MILKMSVLGYVITAMAFFTTFSQCKVPTEKIENEVENIEPSKTVLREKRALYPEHAILAGELTPVFLANIKDNKLVYTRLHPTIMKKALDYFKSNKFHSRKRRNARCDIKLERATPPLEYYAPGGDYRMYWTLRRTLKYWQEVRATDRLFPKGSFNVVATMTDTPPGMFTGYGASARFTGCGNYSSEETWDLTDLTGLIVYDDRDFYNINQAIAEFSHIMGRSATGVGASVEARSFTNEDLRDIKRGLQKATCWEKPLEIYPHGNPVERLFRWDLDPLL